MALLLLSHIGCNTSIPTYVISMKCACFHICIYLMLPKIVIMSIFLSSHTIDNKSKKKVI